MDSYGANKESIKKNRTRRGSARNPEQTLDMHELWRRLLVETFHQFFRVSSSVFFQTPATGIGATVRTRHSDVSWTSLQLV